MWCWMIVVFIDKFTLLACFRRRSRVSFIANTNDVLVLHQTNTSVRVEELHNVVLVHQVVTAGQLPDCRGATLCMKANGYTAGECCIYYQQRTVCRSQSRY